MEYINKGLRVGKKEITQYNRAKELDKYPIFKNDIQKVSEYMKYEVNT